MRYRGRPLVHIDSRLCLARFSKRCRRFHDLTDEPKTPPVDRLDERLPVAVVANRLPGSIDPAAESRLRYDPPVPDRLEQFLLADDPVPVPQQMYQQIVDLWLHVHDLTSSSQLLTIEIDLTFGEGEVHSILRSRICPATPSARDSHGGRRTTAMPGARKLAPSLAAMRFAARLPGANLRSAAVAP